MEEMDFCVLCSEGENSQDIRDMLNYVPASVQTVVADPLSPDVRARRRETPQQRLSARSISCAHWSAEKSSMWASIFNDIGPESEMSQSEVAPSQPTVEEVEENPVFRYHVPLFKKKNAEWPSVPLWPEQNEPIYLQVLRPHREIGATLQKLMQLELLEQEGKPPPIFGFLVEEQQVHVHTLQEALLGGWIGAWYASKRSIPASVIQWLCKACMYCRNAQLASSAFATLIVAVTEKPPLLRDIYGLGYPDILSPNPGYEKKVRGLPLFREFARMLKAMGAEWGKEEEEKEKEEKEKEKEEKEEEESPWVLPRHNLQLGMEVLKVSLLHQINKFEKEELMELTMMCARLVLDPHTSCIAHRVSSLWAYGVAAFSSEDWPECVQLLAEQLCSHAITKGRPWCQLRLVLHIPSTSRGRELSILVSHRMLSTLAGASKGELGTPKQLYYLVRNVARRCEDIRAQELVLCVYLAEVAFCAHVGDVEKKRIKILRNVVKKLRELRGLLAKDSIDTEEGLLIVEVKTQLQHVVEVMESLLPELSVELGRQKRKQKRKQKTPNSKRRKVETEERPTSFQPSPVKKTQRRLALDENLQSSSE